MMVDDINSGSFANFLNKIFPNNDSSYDFDEALDSNIRKLMQDKDIDKE